MKPCCSLLNDERLARAPVTNLTQGVPNINYLVPNTVKLLLSLALIYKGSNCSLQFVENIPRGMVCVGGSTSKLRDPPLAVSTSGPQPLTGPVNHISIEYR